MGFSSETFSISVAATVGARSAGGVGERLRGAVERVRVEVRPGVVEVLGVEAESSAGARGSAEAALGAAGLL